MNDEFQHLVETHRRELQLHCYRMLGSFHDAEDLVQETMLRAWRSQESFEGRAPLRIWLYRIATNACLNALAKRATSRRVLPDMEAPPAVQMPDREPATDIAWLEPYPDSALEGIADPAPGPDARYEMREAVHLAFIAAIQYLPPRQRAALLLRDVLGWPAADTGQILEASIASINSALQRARETLENRLPAGPPRASPEPSEEQRALLARYTNAWEQSDVDGFVAVIKEDAVMSMPPWRQWYLGRDAIGKFFSWTSRLGGHAPFRLVAANANCQPAFAFYGRWQGPEWQAHSIQLLEIDGDSIARMTSFVTPSLFAAFGLPAFVNRR